MKRNKSNSIDLAGDKIGSLMQHYLYAAVISMIVKSIHTVLDGIFIGNKAGANALAAVNIVMPVFAFFMAIAIMVGVGSSTLISMKLGEQKPYEAQGIFVQSMIVIIVSSLVSQVIFLTNTERICRMLGANPALLEPTMIYGEVLVWFSIVAAVGMTLNVLVRNDGNPKLSMYSVVAGALTNIVLNYIFIYPLNMGLYGAGLATGIAQSVQFILLLLHFILEKGQLRLSFKNFKFNKTHFIRTLQIGMPSFVGELAFGMVDLVFNRVLITTGGELAVAAFSVRMYIQSIAAMLFRGVEQAMQPIISFNYGANLYRRVDKTFKLSVRISLISAVVLTVVGIVFAEGLVKLFNRTDIALIDMATEAVRYMFLTMIFNGVNTCVSGYFQAIGYARISTILTVARSMLCEMFMLLFLTHLFGLKGCWLAFPAAEILFFGIGIVLMKKKQDIVVFA